jgi:hypothetical protein
MLDLVGRATVVGALTLTLFSAPTFAVDAHFPDSHDQVPNRWNEPIFRLSQY